MSGLLLTGAIVRTVSWRRCPTRILQWPKFRLAAATSRRDLRCAERYVIAPDRDL
jgi:hypothetical protein